MNAGFGTVNEYRAEMTKETSQEAEWRTNSFLRPLMLLRQLSGYHNLTMLYNILCCRQRDILHQLNNSELINHMAFARPSLKSHLLF